MSNKQHKRLPNAALSKIHNNSRNIHIPMPRYHAKRCDIPDDSNLNYLHLYVSTSASISVFKDKIRRSTTGDIQKHKQRYFPGTNALHVLLLTASLNKQ
jgi:hypothetical protein